MKPGKVFISHSSQDKEFVERLVADLATRSIPVWYDKLDLRVGDSVPGSINTGLADAKHFLIVLSPAALDSAWVREELNAGLMKQVSLGGTLRCSRTLQRLPDPAITGPSEVCRFPERLHVRSFRVADGLGERF